MKKTAIILFVAATAVASTGCARKCKKAREDVLEPTQRVMTYLQTQPDGEDLAFDGCPQIVEDFENLPKGARNIRKIAESRFADTTRTCLWWERSYRTRCETRWRRGPRGRGRRYTHCYSVPYTYCARWQYDRHERPGYKVAMELADDIEEMHRRSHDMCGEAAGGHYDEAESQSRELLRFITGEVKPSGDRVYAMACGD